MRKSEKTISYSFFVFILVTSIVSFFLFSTAMASPDVIAPSVPIGLTVKAINCSQISVYWKASTDTGGSRVKGYNIFRNGLYLKQVLAPYTRTVDKALAASTLYSYAVSAIDSVGNESAKSSAMSATTPACPDITAPSVPAGLTAGAVSCSQINLSWSPSTDTGGSGLKGYNIYRNGLYLKQVPAPSTSTSDTGLTASKLYSYAVSAIDNAGRQSAKSSATTATTPTCTDTTAPSVPGVVTASASSCSQINLSWGGSTDTGGSGLKGYNVYRNGTYLKQVLTTSTSDTGLAASTVYSYAASAIDNVGNESSKSSATSATTPACSDTTAPSVPAGLTAGATSCNQINLSWGASTDTGGSGLKGYNIYRNGSYLKQVLTASASDTGLSASTVYSYAASAVDNAGNESAKSNTASTNTPACADTTAPSVPAGVTATAASCSQINLSWGASTDTGGSGLKGYNLYRNGSYLKQVLTTSASDTGLAASTVYSYAASAVDNVGNESAKSNTASTNTPACPDTTAPSVPAGLVVTAVSSGQINLSWGSSTDTGGSGLAGYKVYRGGSQIGTTTATSYPDSGLAAGTQYCYTVAAYDGAGNSSAPSTQACTTTQSSSSGGQTVWAKKFGGPQNDVGYSVAVESNNGILAAGTFTGTADLGCGFVSSFGATDMYLASHSSWGVCQWVRHFGGVNGYVTPGAIAVDDSGNVLVTGNFSGTVDLGGGPVTSSYADDVFVAKYSQSGAHLWSKVYDDGGVASGTGIAADSAGNVVVAGTFLSYVDFAEVPMYSGDTVIRAYGTPSIFLVKLSSSGTLMWTKSLKPGTNETAYSIVVDKNDNILMSGYFWGTLDFGGGPLTSAGARDIFLAKYSPLGAYIWANTFGSTGSDTGTGVAVDGSGNVVVTGSFMGTVDFGGHSLTSTGPMDVFVAKYSTSGSLLWVRQAKGTNGNTSRGVVVDDSDNVMVTGQFTGSIDFGGGTITGGGGWDIFVAKYSPSGTHLWSKAFTNGAGMGIAADGGGGIVVTGYFSGTTDFGGPILTGAWNDIFLLKLAP